MFGDSTGCPINTWVNAQHSKLLLFPSKVYFVAEMPFEIGFFPLFPRGEIIAHFTINFDKSDAHIDMGRGGIIVRSQQFRIKVVAFLGQFAIFFVFEAFYF